MTDRFSSRKTLPMIALIATILAVLIVPAGPASAGSLIVTRFDDPPPGSCSPGDCSLREAIIAANAAADADAIQLAAGTYSLTV